MALILADDSRTALLHGATLHKALLKASAVYEESSDILDISSCFFTHHLGNPLIAMQAQN